MRALPGTVLLLVSTVLAHVGHQVPIAPKDADWATQHMAEEHHLNGFDPQTLFVMHDFKSAGFWSTTDIRRMYGLLDKSAKDIPEDKKESAAQHILKLFDTDKDGSVSNKEFLDGWSQGVRLPDLGFGPGHHGDDEYEYEIHHWEKYHNDDTTAEELTHPEDIEHFKHHEEEDRLAEEEEKLMEGSGVIETNIPRKYLRTEL
ncbi:secretory pathway protein Ssp120 [Microthyrium microscopicum]|uniref:Secretory pathway protein Ssp120 n=1 Tax=Microthyrium microscopicum TaxID=703497 RepID=A0A6A6U0C0_9PEZI|nr:secretory pathway protein Ssp120 [Microthyrium microscopicum]